MCRVQLFVIREKRTCSQCCCYSESMKQCRETRGHCCLEMTKKHHRKRASKNDRGRSGRNVAEGESDDGDDDGKCHETENEWLGRVQDCFW